MVDEKTMQKMLYDHEKRISELETILKHKKKSTNPEVKPSLSDRIIDCRNKTFFSKSKTAEEVYKEIKDSYPCDFNRVAVALLRLANRKQLRKTSKTINGKEYKAYAW
jgi:hypothetical protein